MENKKIDFIEFPNFVDERGSLCFGEYKKHIPFEITRFFIIYATPQGATRGKHAHKKNKQIYICTHGSAKVLLDDGKNKQEIILDNPSKGLLLNGLVWHEIIMEENSSLLVLNSDLYDEKDYIKDYNEFKRLPSISL